VTKPFKPFKPLKSLKPLLFDIFCRVIDNFGDIGVCWRLSADLAARGQQVRLWVDDASALEWMAPAALQDEWAGIQVLAWAQSHNPEFLSKIPPADVWIEGFGCDIATELVAHYAQSTGIPAWINLEYLSAESWVERCHGLPSHSGKYFFYPGFTAKTGGLLRELDYPFHESQEPISPNPERTISLFCYEPAALSAFLSALDALSTPTQLLVTHGRATAAVQALSAQTEKWERVRIQYLPPMTQREYDALLRRCDFNCVRGEDSLVRAIWAGKPFVWQIYPQDDDAHIDKLNAFLDTINASPSLRALHHAWNIWNVGTPLPPLDDESVWETWSADALRARDKLRAMDDLTTQLLGFVQGKISSTAGK
jgi:uncharacterized repeat protein (TIGR03837 family)